MSSVVRLPTLDPPKRCPAPGKCHCLARSYGDPEPEAPESIWCMGLRKDDQFPGKERAIATVPSDTIVYCNLIGSHSDSHGAQTTVMNIPDLHLILEVWFQALDKIGHLREFFVAAVMTQKDNALKEMLDEGLTAVTMDSVMTQVKCCEELYRSWDFNDVPDKIQMLMEYHETLGHAPVITRSRRVGNGWEEVDAHQRTKGEEE